VAIPIGVVNQGFTYILVMLHILFIITLIVNIWISIVNKKLPLKNKIINSLAYPLVVTISNLIIIFILSAILYYLFNIDFMAQYDHFYTELIY
jgi:hypothetical protein